MQTKLTEEIADTDVTNIPEIQYIDNIMEYRFLAEGEGEGGETAMMDNKNVTVNSTKTNGTTPT